MVKRFCKSVIAILFFFSCANFSMAELMSSDDGSMVGLPLGSEEEVKVDLCPQGVQTVNTFMDAWRKNDFNTMYELIDDESKKDYPFEDAKFDFQFMQFKEYTLSSIRPRGDNFIFILSYGDWKYGDKEIRKMIISGKSFKIIANKGRVFEKSLESYF